MNRCLAMIAVTLVLALPQSGEAKFFQLYVQGQGGYADGSGDAEAHPVLGTVAPTKQDFYDLVNGTSAGAELGITLIGLNLYANFLQFFDDTGSTGTVTKIILGLRPEFDPGDDGDFTFFVRGGAGAMIATFGGDSAFAVEVGETPVGFTVRGGAGISYQIAGPLEIGPQFDIGYYRLLNGTIEPDVAGLTEIQNMCAPGGVLDEECARTQAEQLAAEEGGVGYETSQGIDWSVMLALRVSLGL